MQSDADISCLVKHDRYVDTENEKGHSSETAAGLEIIFHVYC